MYWECSKHDSVAKYLFACFSRSRSLAVVVYCTVETPREGLRSAKHKLFWMVFSNNFEWYSNLNQVYIDRIVRLATASAVFIFVVVFTFRLGIHAAFLWSSCRSGAEYRVTSAKIIRTPWYRGTRDNSNVIWLVLQRNLIAESLDLTEIFQSKY